MIRKNQKKKIFIEILKNGKSIFIYPILGIFKIKKYWNPSINLLGVIVKKKS